MLEVNINQHLSTLTASQLAKLLVMRKGLQFGYDYTFTDDDGQSTDVDLAFLAAAPGELLEVLSKKTSMTTPSTKCDTKLNRSAASASGATTAGEGTTKST